MRAFEESKIQNHDMPILRNRKHGQALMEVALILPILILLVLGALQVGIIIFTNIVVENAAREGANYLAYHPADQSNLLTVVTNEAKNSSGASMMILSATPSSPLTLYQPFTVTVKACVSGFYLLSLFRNVTD